MSEYQLENWAVSYRSDNLFLAPECNPICLVGHRDNDLHRIITSPIVEVNGRIVKTFSGSIYFLGKPAPEYLEYLESIGYSYDEKNPLKRARKNVLNEQARFS